MADLQRATTEERASHLPERSHLAHQEPHIGLSAVRLRERAGCVRRARAGQGRGMGVLQRVKKRLKVVSPMEGAGQRSSGPRGCGHRVALSRRSGDASRAGTLLGGVNLRSISARSRKGKRLRDRDHVKKNWY